jgi:hypothetical protein
MTFYVQVLCAVSHAPKPLQCPCNILCYAKISAPNKQQNYSPQLHNLINFLNAYLLRYKPPHRSQIKVNFTYTMRPVGTELHSAQTCYADEVRTADRKPLYIARCFITSFECRTQPHNLASSNTSFHAL